MSGHPCWSLLNAVVSALCYRVKMGKVACGQATVFWLPLRMGGAIED